MTGGCSCPWQGQGGPIGGRDGQEEGGGGRGLGGLLMRLRVQLVAPQRDMRTLTDPSS